MNVDKSDGGDAKMDRGAENEAQRTQGEEGKDRSEQAGISRRQMLVRSAWGAGLLAATPPAVAQVTSCGELSPLCTTTSDGADFCEFGTPAGWERLEAARVTTNVFFVALQAGDVHSAMQQIADDYEDDEGDRDRLEGAITDFVNQYDPGTLTLTDGCLHTLSDQAGVIAMLFDVTVAGSIEGSPTEVRYQMHMSLAEREGFLRIIYILLSPAA